MGTEEKPSRLRRFRNLINKNSITRWSIFGFLISIGGYGVGYGWVIANAGDETFKQALHDPSLYPIPINETHRIVTPNSNINYVIIFYNTTDVFTVNNPAHYIINANTTNPDNIKKLITIFTTDTMDTSILNDPKTLNGLMNNYQIQFGTDAHEMSRVANSNIFYTESNFIKNSEFQGTFLFLEQDIDGHEYWTFLKGNSIIIHPITAKLQAENNRIIKLQNYQSAQSNTHVEGLTWVIIGLVPIAIAMEIPIHRYLTTK